MQVLLISSSRRPARRIVAERSVRAAHPEATVTVLWTDPRLTAPPDANVLVPHGLDIDGLRWVDLVLMAGERAAAWAALPWLLTAGLDVAAGSPVVVLDDTLVVTGRLDDLLASSDGPVMRAGHVSGGLVWGGPLPGAVVLQGEVAPLLGWWRDRSRDWVHVEDQGPKQAVSAPWWAPVDAVRLCGDPRFRLSASTADEVAVSDVDGVLLTATGPPALVDLAGLDPSAPWWFSLGDDLPRCATSDSAGLRRLLAEQSTALLAAGWQPEQDRDDTALIPGLDVTDGIRAWFRSRQGGASSVANPYVVDEVAAFVDALNAPGRPDGTGVSVLADLVYDARPDVQHAFPSPRWRDRDGFRRWLWTSAVAERATSLATLPAPPRPGGPVRTAGVRRPFGVNVVGYLGAELGLGVAARQMLRALDAAGIPTATVTYDRTASQQEVRSDGTTNRPYHFNLLLIVPDQLSLFVDDVGADFLRGHHNIGLWYWESDVMNTTQMAAFDHVDEVWAATSYLRDAFESAGRAPVSLVPSPLVFDVDAAAARDARGRLGLDERFTFLFSFDFLSVVERKNPLGLVDAYRRAFAPGDGARLVLKSINGGVFPRAKARLADAIADRDDIELWDRMLPASDRLALVGAADAYVSLHRAEGLGLTMAEAMAVGTPVIATGYSGNIDFMDGSNALLVPYRLVEVGAGSHYPAHGHWADPDLDAAAALMRSLHDDPSISARLIPAARRSLEQFSFAEVGAVARDRLIGIWSGHQSR
ncbi:MAG: glycosyltransferase [Actinobacteria bacterium]|nr:glycosyltransferase [Actinomycetota bacterium]